MTPKTKKILLVVGIAAATTGVLIYMSKKNQEEGEVLLDIINKSASEIDKNAAAQQAIQEIKDVKFDKNKIKIGALSGPLSNPAIASAVAKINVALYTAMKGVGTDIKPLAQALTQIKNKNTMSLIDKTFKAQYGEGLFEMMAGESKLNNVAYKVFSDKTKNEIAIPFYSEAHWHPSVSAWLQKIPVY